MAHDSIGRWVDKAKAVETSAAEESGVKVIRREMPVSRGNMILDIAERLRPFLTELFQGVRDSQGMLYQPAHVRGVALNMAQGLLKEQETSGQ